MYIKYLLHGLNLLYLKLIYCVKIKYNKVRYRIVCQICLFYNKRANTVIKIIPITSMTNPVIKNDFPVFFP